MFMFIRALAIVSKAKKSRAEESISPTNTTNAANSDSFVEDTEARKQGHQRKQLDNREEDNHTGSILSAQATISTADKSANMKLTYNTMKGIWHYVHLSKTVQNVGEKEASPTILHDNEQDTFNREVKKQSTVCNSITSQESQIFIARVKKRSAKILSEFLEIATKQKEEPDLYGWSRHALRLFRGHDDLILGFFSFIPDTAESELQDLRTKISICRYCMASTMKAKQQVAIISKMLVAKITEMFVDERLGPLDFNSILEYLHAEDNRLIAVFPTTDALRVLISACYQMTGGDRIVQSSLAQQANVETRQLCFTIRSLLLIALAYQNH